MTEPLSHKIQVSVVWLPADWDQSPVQGGETAFALTAQDAASLCEAHFTVAADLPVQQFLNTHLSESAQDELANRARGVSIWGHRIKADQRLAAQDRIELLGPISADPKSDRRARVKQERAGQPDRRWRR
jgi:putative ubiquitin-RnfH superfamily antitoxin RatB of RatAB toxin-antitoxin module